MSRQHHGARRVPLRSIRVALVALVATTVAAAGLAVAPERTDAATALKVVVVVGPTGAKTSNYIYNARKLATQARGYGASVTEIYSPNATWSKVKAAAQGANVLIYLGHGNGWPSPYGPFQTYTKDGMGLNSAAGRGHYNVKYWGEHYVGREIRLAPNAVVILNRLCYASGNSEPGRANPTKSVAIQRVDNYGAGFLRAGAKAVYAEAISSAGYVLSGLFRSNRNVSQIFWSAGSATRTYSFGFSSKRTAGARALLDPKSPGRYYRSVIGTLDLSAAAFRN